MKRQSPGGGLVYGRASARETKDWYHARNNDVKGFLTGRTEIRTRLTASSPGRAIKKERAPGNPGALS
ncbi:MAG: hypothetical protein A2X91_02955 [Deltaproteobacteria bacterium GWB2_65_81]|nr:MAG: hypothetical protein A2X90_06430 [Deltaproteobacteria bacterium GWA2_65_63]OGP28539.1 MAG: hypothetical protein A2X91_02955 [Deltaproteobacteria bacterium GWB2_65_81]OGP37105.1 MAG: hypothetical protein A2X98_00295 [Deltaproteobacteria bacterium GWC2_66_88]HAM32756.1 hypothetical protein [Deltaproteobacteria bacterium]